MRRIASRRTTGFTLVELLVVVSIIALLISILLPSLRKARDQAKTVKCAANERQVGQALAAFIAESNGLYPPSYAYPTKGQWDPSHPENQELSSVPYGYTHWSYFLYSSGRAKDEAFQCPNFPEGGAPRTNPGMQPEDWEPGQQDANNNTNPNSLVDKQARRMAYAANAAVMPRNKFTIQLAKGVRRNVMVKENMIKRPGSTILATEYLRNWKALGIDDGGAILVKSHRPINVFYHLGTGANEYQAPPMNPGFLYGIKASPNSERDYGLLPLAEVKDKTNILDYTSGLPQINAVGRSHPGGNSAYGGTANFLFVDTHVEKMTPLQSLVQRLWGDRYYSLTGANEVLNMTVPN